MIEKIICNGLEKSGHIIDKEQCEGFLKILFNRISVPFAIEGKFSYAT